MPAVFRISKAKNGKYFFNLLAANGEKILRSQMYASKRTARNGIESVRNNAGESKQFDRRRNKAGKHYFVLKAKNHQVIGTSEGYFGKSAMEKEITSVARSHSADTVDNS